MDGAAAVAAYSPPPLLALTSPTSLSPLPPASAGQLAEPQLRVELQVEAGGVEVRDVPRDCVHHNRRVEEREALGLGDGALWQPDDAPACGDSIPVPSGLSERV